jgi:hypothetical protein
MHQNGRIVDALVNLQQERDEQEKNIHIFAGKDDKHQKSIGQTAKQKQRKLHTSLFLAS